MKSTSNDHPALQQKDAPDIAQDQSNASDISRHVRYFQIISPNSAGEHANAPDGSDLQQRYLWLEDRVAYLDLKHMEVNQLLLGRIREHERTETALQQSQEKLHLLLKHQDQVKEDERKRIAREIHDELGQNLLALRIDVSLLQTRAGKRNTGLRQWAEMVLANVDATIKSIKTLVNGLRPFEPELGLFAAIEWQLNAFSRINAIPHTLQIDEELADSLFSDEQALTVFRILQEATNNIAHHSMASFAQVRLDLLKARFSMTVHDNGIGFVMEHHRKKKSFGLIGIAERVSALKGECKIDSAPGAGTTLHINFYL